MINIGLISCSERYPMKYAPIEKAAAMHRMTSARTRMRNRMAPTIRMGQIAMPLPLEYVATTAAAIVPERTEAFGFAPPCASNHKASRTAHCAMDHCNKNVLPSETELPSQNITTAANRGPATRSRFDTEGSDTKLLASSIHNAA